MPDWKTRLNFDLVTPLLESHNPYITYFTKKDLLESEEDPPDTLWNLPAINDILSKQQLDGSWKLFIRPDELASGVKYALIDTWDQLRTLTDLYGLTKKHKRIELAAEFIFSHQTKEGDIRGTVANQYASHHTGAIIATLMKAGYSYDPRIEKSIRWLLNIRQYDGGWSPYPGLSGYHNLTTNQFVALLSGANSDTVKMFDKSRTSSIIGTGMVLWAFAYHPVYQKSDYAITAAKLLKSAFFKKDNWPYLFEVDDWFHFQFPFRWNDLISALNAISFILPNQNDPNIYTALQWLQDNQQEDGLWKESYSKKHKNSLKNESAIQEQRLWISLAIGRILKRFYEY